jgi:UPF0755 protein
VRAQPIVRAEPDPGPGVPAALSGAEPVPPEEHAVPLASLPSEPPAGIEEEEVTEGHEVVDPDAASADEPVAHAPADAAAEISASDVPPAPVDIDQPPGGPPPYVEPPPVEPLPEEPGTRPIRVRDLAAAEAARTAGEGGREFDQERPRLPPPPPLALGGRSGTRAAPPRARRPGRARVGALAALAAALVVVAGVLYALLHKSSKKPAAAGPPVVKVLIPEGKTRLQIAQIAAHAGLRGSYRLASRSSPLLTPSQYGAPSSTKDLEGFLFPATYDEYLHAPVSRLVAEQLEAFKENFGAEMVSAAHALHVTPYQMLIVASMVEREALLSADRPKVAAVIYNRLAKGIPLGIDATLYYAIELQRNIPTYTAELSEAQLHLSSAYNTRTHVGLPPTPISNPGVASLEAAAHPSRKGYLYYVAGTDGCGDLVFAETAATWEADKAAYEAAVSRNGGHPPACKKK